MLRCCVGGRLEDTLAMAAFAAVPVRQSRELRFMNVTMACNAGKIFNPVDNHSRIRHMTFRTFYFEVMLFQGEPGFVVLCHAEGSLFEILDSMAFVAIAAFGSGGELAVMRIPMAVQTPRKNQRLRKIAARMTCVARNSGMFPLKREPGLRMLENGRGIRRLPPGIGIVAGSASGFEAVRVRIPMAGRAILKRNAFVFYSRLCPARCHVAFVTCNLQVCFVELESGLSVIKASGIFPIPRIMATLASGR